MKYSGKKDGTYAILMVRYEEDNELGLSKSTLNSMREVENSAVLYYEKGL